MPATRRLLYPALLAVAVGLPERTPAPLRVPTAVRAALARHGCPVPAVVRAGQRPAVIRGRFANEPRIDWAAECGNAVVVIALGAVAGVDSIAPRGDGLQVAVPGYIRRHHASYGSVADTLGLGRIDRDGVEVLAGDCCSLIYYWDGHRWRELPGAD